MGKEIIYSFKEYQEKYIVKLGDFCKNTEFDELDFITTERDCYEVYLTSLSIYKRIRNHIPGGPFLDEDTIFLNSNCTSYDLIVEDLKNEAKSKGLNRTDDIITNHKVHFNKIISFLETKRSELENELTSNTQKLETELLDLSNTSAVEKIIYLNELGIIDFLRTKREFTGSTNLMATILSAITGEKTTTLQTSLNRLITDDTTSKKHPYKAQKTVERVRQTLIDKNIKLETS